MKDMDTWLKDMRDRPLPGGVAAAAVAGAMGGALIAKSVDISLDRQEMDDTGRATMKEVLRAARRQFDVLLELSEADVRAYRGVLDTASLPERDPTRQDAQRAATEVPIGVAEACDLLLARVPEAIPHCWPGVCVDFEIGCSLLSVGRRAGVLAAEANMSAWADAGVDGEFQARIDALRQNERAGG